MKSDAGFDRDRVHRARQPVRGGGLWYHAGSDSVRQFQGDLVTEVDIIAMLSKFGAACAGLLVANYAGVWVWGREYRKLEQDRDRWMHIALRNVGIAEKSTQIRASLPVEP